MVRRRPSTGDSWQRSLACDNRADAVPAGHRVVERRIAVPGRSGQSLVAATELDEKLVGPVGHHKSMPCEFEYGRRVGVAVEAVPPVGRNCSENAHLFIAQRDLGALQDRHGKK
jgi:hypothetical protein